MAWQKRHCGWGLEEMSFSLLFLLHRISMRFQGTLGAVDAVSALSGRRWSAASSERALGSAPICSSDLQLFEGMVSHA
jgi:hypothetical protein